MNKQTAIGSAVIGLVAAGVLWILSKKKPQQKRVVMRTKVVPKDQILEQRFNAELKIFLGKLHINDADVFLKYLWELERVVKNSRDQNLCEMVTKNLTFMLSIRNKVDHDRQSSLIINQIVQDFPDEIKRLTSDLPEMAGKICYAMARGLSDSIEHSIENEFDAVAEAAN